MRTTAYFFLALACLPLTLLQAQYGYGNDYYGRRQSTIPRAEDPGKEPEPQTAEAIVAAEMPKIKETVELSAFEEAVVSSILTKYIQQTIELRLLKLEPDKMRAGMDKIRENQKAELEAGLPEETFRALVELQENGYKKVKKKKKKKGKKPDS